MFDRDAIFQIFRRKCFQVAFILSLFSVFPQKESFTGQVQYNEVTLKDLLVKSDWIVLAEFVKTSGKQALQLHHFKCVDVLKSPSSVSADRKPGLLFSVQAAYTSEREHLSVLSDAGVSKSTSVDFFTTDASRFPLGNSLTTLKPGKKYILFLNYVAFLKKFEENLYEFSANGAFLDGEKQGEVHALLVGSGAGESGDLYEAAGAGNIERVKKLVMGGALIDDPIQDGFTALMVATEHGRSDVVKFLLESGGSVLLPNKHGSMPIDYAVKFKHVDIEKMLRAAISEHEKYFKAVKLNDLPQVKAFLTGKQNVHIANTERKSHFQVAIESGSLEVAKYLKEIGAGVDKELGHNIFPINVAAEAGRLEMVKWLSSEGAYAAHGGPDGRTAVDLALHGNNLELKDFLINVVQSYNYYDAPHSEVEFEVSSVSDAAKGEKSRRIKATVISCKSYIRKQKPRFKHKVDFSTAPFFEETATVEFTVAASRELKVGQEYSGLVFHNKLKPPELLITAVFDERLANERVLEHRVRRAGAKTSTEREATRRVEKLNVAEFERRQKRWVYRFTRKDGVPVIQTKSVRVGSLIGADADIFSYQEITKLPKDASRSVKEFYGTGQLESVYTLGLGDVRIGDALYYDMNGYLESKHSEKQYPFSYQDVLKYVTARGLSTEEGFFSLTVSNGGQDSHSVWDLTWFESAEPWLLKKRIFLSTKNGEVEKSFEEKISRGGRPMRLEGLFLHPDWGLRTPTAKEIAAFEFSRLVPGGTIRSEAEYKTFWSMVTNLGDSMLARPKKDNPPVRPEVDFTRETLIWSGSSSSSFGHISFPFAVEHADKIELRPEIHYTDYGSHFLKLWVIPKTDKAIKFLEAKASHDTG